jgi:oxygen-dependent protoporphyrinogen oxidase
MHELVDALAGSLGSVLRLSSGANGLLKGRSLSLESGESSPGFRVAAAGVTLEADAVVLTGPASESAALVRPFDSTLASLIGDIPTAPLSVVCLGYDEAAVASDRGPLDGFGFLVPRSEGIRTLGALWETSIYANRAPAGKALIRAMIGGALDSTAVDLTDEDVVGIVRTDLRRTMGLRVAPEFVRVIRHPRGIPQYNVGHLARLQRIDTLLQVHPGLILAGNSYRGVSINSCIAEAGQVADRALAAADARRARVPELMIR